VRSLSLRLLALSCSGMLLAQMPKSDALIFEAMRAELQRVKELKLMAGEPIHFAEFTVDDVLSYNATASLGSLIGERTTRVRLPRTTVKLGDTKLDSSNYLLSDMNFVSRFDPEVMPLDDNLTALRHSLWLSMDRSLKSAVEVLGRKRAALRAINQTETLNDLAAAMPAKTILPGTFQPIDTKAWRERTRRLSAVFREFPEISTSSIEFENTQDYYLMANSDGMEVRLPDHISFLRVRANAQAKDGARLRDHLILLAGNINDLPAEEALKASVRKVGENLRQLLAAPVGEDYAGPVLFEAEAGAQLIGEHLGMKMFAFRKPVVEPNRRFPMSSAELEGRVGVRILPENFTIIDDPLREKWQDRDLAGYYPVDLEGMKPKAVTLVEKGVFRGFLTSRQPIRGQEGSTGHARLPGNFGHKQAYFSNLIVDNKDGLPAAELKTKLIEMVKQRGKSFGYMVRKMDFPSTASMDELGRMNNNGGLVAKPLLLYRVYPDGREELVRGMRFRGLGLRSMKDIAFASKESYRQDIMGSPAPLSLTGAGGFVTSCSIIAPALLFEDLELEPIREETPRVPLVEPPSLP
jgi:TldD protein